MKILKFHKEDIATRKKVGAQLRYPSPGSNTAKFSGKSHSASWHLTLSTHRQTQANICPLLLREDSPWHLSPPLTKAYLLFHIRRKKKTVLTPLSQHVILTVQSERSSQKIPFQSLFNTLLDLPKSSPVQSSCSRVQNPNLFLWLPGDLPGGRQPGQETGHSGCCQGHRKTHQMTGNGKELGLPKGQHSLFLFIIYFY